MKSGGLLKKIQAFINTQKNEGLRPQHIETSAYSDLPVMVQVYQAYEQICAKSGTVDFAELLLRAYELLRDNQDLLVHYQARFKQILVDEFQDTNTIQYAWLRLLCGTDNHIMAVGDDDQSIYGWRGAKIENIQRFRKDFPNAMTFLLQENYRSTGTILSAANALIANNVERLEDKALWTSEGDGDLIPIYAAFNEFDEARYIVGTLGELTKTDCSPEDCVVLYRSNAQSRVLEEALLEAGIHYRIFGGQRFFERSEIKDGLGYLRLLANRHDDAAFERVVNTPTRGIGHRSLMLLRDYAKANSVSLWQSAIEVVAQQALPARASNALVAFLKLIDTCEEETRALSLDKKNRLLITCQWAL